MKRISIIEEESDLTEGNVVFVINQLCSEIQLRLNPTLAGLSEQSNSNAIVLKAKKLQESAEKLQKSLDSFAKKDVFSMFLINKLLKTFKSDMDHLVEKKPGFLERRKLKNKNNKIGAQSQEIIDNLINEVKNALSVLVHYTEKHEKASLKRADSARLSEGKIEISSETSLKTSRK
jgi:hypothetical protein